MPHPAYDIPEDAPIPSGPFLLAGEAWPERRRILQIRQNRVNWLDWDGDWVFHDSRLNLLHGSDSDFLRFLCDTVHPVVRQEAEEVEVLVAIYNRDLAADGWTLVETKEISGRPVFSPQKIGHRAGVFDEPTGWQKVHRLLQEV